MPAAAKMDKGSYMLIEPGMPVRGTDADLGTVAELVADVDADIFRGVMLSHGLFSANVFVPGERITSVAEGIVYTDLTRDEAARLTPPAT